MSSKQADIVNNLYKNLSDHKVVSQFDGQFTQVLIDKLLDDGKVILDELELKLKTQRRAYSILVECLENILRHGEFDNSSEDPHGIMIMGTTDESIFITAGNPIHVDSIERLRTFLQEVNDLDKAGLKERYRRQIRFGGISEKGGAGLGILQIAMKSEQRIEFNFSEYRENYQFFTMQINIPKN